MIHRADLEPLDNLELFGMSPLYTLDSYRAMGRNAAGYALGHAVGPVPTTLDNFARAKLIVKTTLLHARETEAIVRALPPSSSRSSRRSGETLWLRATSLGAALTRSARLGASATCGSEPQSPGQPPGLPATPQCFAGTPWTSTWMCSFAAPLDSASAFVSASMICGTDSSVTRVS